MNKGIITLSISKDAIKGDIKAMREEFATDKIIKITN